MSAVFSGNTTPCNDFDINAGVLNTALENVEILNQGQLQLTLIDGTVVINNIPYFVDYIITGVNLTQELVPNLNEINFTPGTYQINAQQYTLLLGGTIFCNPSDPTFDRIDLIYLDTLGNINYLPGLAVLNPVVPTLPPNTLKVAEIGVEAGATGSNGYTLTSININSVITSAGFLTNQTLRWNAVSGKWVPTSGLLTNPAQQTVIGGIAGFGGMDALTKLQVGGAINIEDNSAPTPVTNKLYAVAGILYWNGTAIGTSTIVPGTSIGNTLYWDGIQWNETDDWKRRASNGGFSEPFYNYLTTDATGVNVNLKIGESEYTGARGYELEINDTLNGNYYNNSVSAGQGNNGSISFSILNNDLTNDFGSTIQIDPSRMLSTFSLLSDPSNGNFTEETSQLYNKRIGNDITTGVGDYTDIFQNTTNINLTANFGSVNRKVIFDVGPTNTFFKVGNAALTTGPGIGISSSSFSIGDIGTLGNTINISPGSKDLTVLYNNQTHFQVLENKVNIGKRLSVGAQIIGAGNYLIDSVERVSHYIIIDDTASNTITLPLVTGNDNAIIKIVRSVGTNNFNKQIIAVGGSTFNNTLLTTYNLSNINESVTLQGSVIYNTWFVIDSRFETDGEHFASYYFNNNAIVTPLPVVNIAVKVLGTTTAAGSSNFTLTNNRATYIKNAGNTTFSIGFSAQLFVNAVNQNLSLFLYKNGVVINESIIQNRYVSSGIAQSMYIQCTQTLVNGDFIEVWVANNSSAGTNVTMVNGNFIIKEI